MTFTIIHRLQVIYKYLLCSLLFVKHLIYTNKLIVHSFLYTTKINVRGNETEINWKTTGCHKIFIKGLGTLPGNASSLTIVLEKSINPIEIIFFGIGSQKEMKNFVIETNLPALKNKFTPNSNISNLTSISFFQQNLKKILINSFRLREPRSIKIKEAKIIPNKSKVISEPFKKSNYPIKS